MGQDEVYSYLRDRRLINDDSYYSVKEIYINLGKITNVKSVGRCISRLYCSGFIERRFRCGVPVYRCRKDMI